MEKQGSGKMVEITDCNSSNNSVKCSQIYRSGVNTFPNCLPYNSTGRSANPNLNTNVSSGNQPRRNKVLSNTSNGRTYFDLNEAAALQTNNVYDYKYNTFYSTDLADYYWLHIPMPYWSKNNMYQTDLKNKYNQYSSMGFPCWRKSTDVCFQPPYFCAFSKTSKITNGTKMPKKDRAGSSLRTSYKNDETDDKILYKGYGHLLRFNKETFSWEWINRGHLKILQKENDYHCIRLLMYSKTSRAPVLNQSLYSQNEFKFDEIERFTVSWMHKFFCNERFEQNKYGLRFRNYNRSEKFLLAVRAVKTQMLYMIDGKYERNEDMPMVKSGDKLIDPIQDSFSVEALQEEYGKDETCSETNMPGCSLNKNLNNIMKESDDDNDSEEKNFEDELAYSLDEIKTVLEISANAVHLPNNTLSKNSMLLSSPSEQKLSIQPFRYANSKGMFFNPLEKDLKALEAAASYDNLMNENSKKLFNESLKKSSGHSIQGSINMGHTSLSSIEKVQVAVPKIAWINTGFSEFVPHAKFHKAQVCDEYGSKTLDVIWTNPKKMSDFEQYEGSRRMLEETIEKENTLAYLEKQKRSEKAKKDIIEKLKIRDEICKDPNIFLAPKTKKQSYSSLMSHSAQLPAKQSRLDYSLSIRNLLSSQSLGNKGSEPSNISDQSLVSLGANLHRSTSHGCKCEITEIIDAQDNKEEVYGDDLTTSDSNGLSKIPRGFEAEQKDSTSTLSLRRDAVISIDSLRSIGIRKSSKALKGVCNPNKTYDLSECHDEIQSFESFMANRLSQAYLKHSESRLVYGAETDALAHTLRSNSLRNIHMAMNGPESSEDFQRMDWFGRPETFIKNDSNSDMKINYILPNRAVNEKTMESTTVNKEGPSFSGITHFQGIPPVIGKDFNSPYGTNLFYNPGVMIYPQVKDFQIEKLPDEKPDISSNENGLKKSFINENCNEKSMFVAESKILNPITHFESAERKQNEIGKIGNESVAPGRPLESFDSQDPDNEESLMIFELSNLDSDETSGTCESKALLVKKIPLPIPKENKRSIFVPLENESELLVLLRGYLANLIELADYMILDRTCSSSAKALKYESLTDGESLQSVSNCNTDDSTRPFTKALPLKGCQDLVSCGDDPNEPEKPILIINDKQTSMIFTKEKYLLILKTSKAELEEDASLGNDLVFDNPKISTGTERSENVKSMYSPCIAEEYGLVESNNLGNANKQRAQLKRKPNTKDLLDASLSNKTKTITRVTTKERNTSANNFVKGNSPTKTINMAADSKNRTKPNYVQETKNRLKCFNIFKSHLNKNSLKCGSSEGVATASAVSSNTHRSNVPVSGHKTATTLLSKTNLSKPPSTENKLKVNQTKEPLNDVPIVSSSFSTSIVSSNKEKGKTIKDISNRKSPRPATSRKPTSTLAGQAKVPKAKECQSARMHSKVTSEPADDKTFKPALKPILETDQPVGSKASTARVNRFLKASKLAAVGSAISNHYSKESTKDIKQCKSQEASSAKDSTKDKISNVASTSSKGRLLPSLVGKAKATFLTSKTNLTAKGTQKNVGPAKAKTPSTPNISKKPSSAEPNRSRRSPAKDGQHSTAVKISEPKTGRK